MTAQAEELRVLSYNIHHARGLDGKVDVERIAKVIRGQKPDLVALQEVDVNVRRSGNVNQIKRLAKLLGIHFVFGKTIDLQGGEYGNAVLSKYPIEKSTVHKLPGAGEPRVLLEAVVKIRKKKFSFCSVHLDHKSEATRMEQVREIKKVLKDREGPIILAGDLNATPQSAPMRALAEMWSIVPKQGKPSTIPADKPIREIDYILLKNLEVEAEGNVVAEKVASDHRPVLGVMKLR